MKLLLGKINGPERLQDLVKMLERNQDIMIVGAHVVQIEYQVIAVQLELRRKAPQVT